MKYVVGTRGSKLALVQTNYVCERLKNAYPEDEFTIKIIKTKGDLVQDRPLNQIGAKGLFVKEIEEQILAGEISFGVHSMKDMPALPAKGLVFARPWKREDPRDVLILRKASSFAELSPGAVLGTGSKRRAFQLKRLRDDLQIVDIRGNVDTRLQKMEQQKLDGIVLAAAGLKRLGMQERITQYLEPDDMIPAPAQGILALEVCAEDSDLLDKINALCDAETDFCAAAEREFLLEIGGDCHVPIGAICEKTDNDEYELRTMFGDEEGHHISYAQVLGDDAIEMAHQAVKEIKKKTVGTVYLLGAGPGDPGLLTVRGMELIRQADCLIYDRLASPVLLDEAKEPCEKIYVGKANHHHTMEQEDINALLVEKANEYKCVVRLKGGDVYVFGRGGEEGLALAKAGIKFEVVPGVTSAIAGLAYAGIPITHRGIAGGFQVVTAHNKRDKLADIDFQAMAESPDTKVFLMGLSKVGEIAENLLAAGMKKETKAAVISHATMAEQKVCTGQLWEIAKKVEQADLTSPALIVVGEVVALREQLNFFEKKPRLGKKYLVPKIGSESSPLTKNLRRQGACVEEVTVGEIVFRDVHLERKMVEELDWLIFTSQHAVTAFMKLLQKNRYDIRNLSGCKIAVIGKKIEKVLHQYGLYANLIPSTYNSSELAGVLKEKISQSDHVCYVKAEQTAGDLQQCLAAVCQWSELVVYENEERDFVIPSDIEEYDGVYFTCASSVERIMACLGEVPEKWKRETCVYSIGPKCTKCLNTHGVEHVIQAKNASYEALLKE